MSKYTFNVNNFSIEKDKQFFAYTNVMDANRIIKTLNKQEEEIKSLKLENQLLLEEIKEIRDKLMIYLEIKGADVK